MIGLLAVLVVLIVIAWRARPRKQVVTKPDGSVFIWRDGSDDDPPPAA